MKLSTISKSQNRPAGSFWKWNKPFKSLRFKTHQSHADYLGFDWSVWIVLAKSEILITKGMVWKASSDKWKASKSKHVLGKIHRIRCRRHAMT